MSPFVGEVFGTPLLVLLGPIVGGIAGAWLFQLLLTA
jgi:glycerol uptake facilitator-like aquaporin